MRAVITPQLSPLAAPIENLTLDPDNARVGDVAAIRRSLNVFGQRKPVVVRQTGADADGQPTGIVVAGNHTLRAAIDLGWDHVAAVFVADDATMSKAYALADNRTGELATWDEDQLAATLRELDGESFDMDALGWSNDDLAKLLGDTPRFEPLPDDDENPRLDQRNPTMCPQCSFEWRVGPRGEIEPI